MKLELDLSDRELSLLVTHLQRHIELLDRDLVRTDNPTMQHELAREVEALESVRKRIAAFSH